MKPLHHMTREEHDSVHGKPKKNTTVTGGFHPHKNAIETAINQGKEIPDEVLDDYPDLQKEHSNLSRMMKKLKHKGEQIMNPALLEKVLMKLKAAGQEGMELGGKGIGLMKKHGPAALDMAGEGAGKVGGAMAGGADKIKATALAELIRKNPKLAGALGLGAGAAGLGGAIGSLGGDDDGDEGY